MKKTLLLKVPKGKKGNFYCKRMRPVKEDNENYYFLQDEAKTITFAWRLAKCSK